VKGQRGFNLGVFHDAMMDVAALKRAPSSGALPAAFRSRTCRSCCSRLFFPELGVQLTELLEVGYVTLREGLSHTLLPWLPHVRGCCHGVVLSGHAEMVPFVMLCVPRVKELSSWVVTLLVGAVVIGAIGDEVIACEQELQHGLKVIKPREV
jgi:hypothetical protein